MAIARIAYPCLAPLSIHGSSKRFRELVTYRERTPISSVSRVRKSYIYHYLKWEAFIADMQTRI